MSDKPRVFLVGQNGNVFNLAGIVYHALNRAGLHEKAREFQARLLECESYDAALHLMAEYVEIDSEEDEDDD